MKHYLKDVFRLMATGVALIFLAAFIAAYGTFKIVFYPKRKW